MGLCSFMQIRRSTVRTAKRYLACSAIPRQRDCSAHLEALVCGSNGFVSTHPKNEHPQKIHITSFDYVPRKLQASLLIKATEAIRVFHKIFDFVSIGKLNRKVLEVSVEFNCER